MNHQPPISVLIPFYNAEKYIAEAIESVLNQSMKTYEILLLDDGSTDESAKIAESYKPSISLFHQKNSGISAARNALIERATGEFIAFLDADDIWTEDHIEKLIEPFTKDEDLGVSSGYVQQFLSPDITEPTVKIPEGNEVLPGYVVGAFMIKAEVFKTVGNFNEDLTIAETVDWFARVKDLEVGFTMLEDVILKRRLHNSNTGISERMHRKDYAKALLASIKRKRKGQ